MIWQDFVLSGGSFVLLCSSAATLWSPRKPPLRLSVPYTLVLLAFTVAYGTLDLALASCVTFVSSVVWGTLVFQEAFRGKL